MPLGSSFLAAYLTLTLGVIPVVAAASTAGPGQSDIFAMVGAALGAVLAGLEAIKRGRDYRHLASVILASSGVGCIAPGAILYSSLAPDRLESLTWHSWAATGFVCALGGWAFAHGVMSVFLRRLPRAIDRQFDRIDPPSTPQ